VTPCDALPLRRSNLENANARRSNHAPFRPKSAHKPRPMRVARP